jgi:hypothetical protein
VHGVAGVEPERSPARAAEGLQQLLDDLVRPVGGPQVAGGQPVPEVVGQVLAQLDGVPVWVAVQGRRGPGHRVGDGPLQRAAGRVGVLIGVQPDRHVDLRRAVRMQVFQVIPNGQW